MTVEIIDKPLVLDIYGISGVAVNKDYTGTAFKLNGKMWETLKVNNLKNKGLNIWVYDYHDTVFTGVQLENTPEHETGLEHKIITLDKYAYYKHIGPYKLIKQTGINMQQELKNKGFETCLPYIEIYGHWTSDETKSETELLMSLRSECL